MRPESKVTWTTSRKAPSSRLCNSHQLLFDKKHFLRPRNRALGGMLRLVDVVCSWLCLRMKFHWTRCQRMWRWTHDVGCLRQLGLHVRVLIVFVVRAAGSHNDFGRLCVEVTWFEREKRELCGNGCERKTHGSSCERHPCKYAACERLVRVWVCQLMGCPLSWSIWVHCGSKFDVLGLKIKKGFCVLVWVWC